MNWSRKIFETNTHETFTLTKKISIIIALQLFLAIWVNTRNISHLPQQSRYIVWPVGGEHNEEKSDANQNNSGQLHACKVRTVEYDIEC